MIIEDPLILSNLEVYDIATARYAMKISNDYHFAIIHMREEMEKAFLRSQQEVKNQKIAILTPYLPTISEQGQLTPFGRGIIPEPLPKTVPQFIVDALNYLDAQLALERQRLEAELEEEIAPLYEMIEQLETLTKPWAINEFQNQAVWLADSNHFVIGGCTITYVNSDVTFEYEELDYGD